MELQDFFDYLDCDKDGLISSEDIFRAFKNLKTDFPVKSSMINDFVLKTMDSKTASLDNRDFLYGVLVGMFERVVSNNEINESDLKPLVEVRKRQALNGNGPQ